MLAPLPAAPRTRLRWHECAFVIAAACPRTLGALARQYFKYGKGRACTVRRHSIRVKPRQLAPVAIFLALFALPFAALHPIFALPTLVWMMACLGLGVLVGLRSNHKPMAFLSGIPAMIMHVTWGGGFASEWLRLRKLDTPLYGLAHDQ